ncbi:isoamyl alcohol oxidase [Fusarium mexicanum]|uniref:Isoamyl alcohol oxidase n=1 Tax=Fusarium mexicanum TaxID=751941 RepID=A0A8H5JK68_9HYPO|nr:isoamyl alcohol oxidase [Fusarium mexicanum]
MKSLLSLALLPLALLIDSSSATNTSCRCLPSDKCWPADSVWAKFNTTVNGALIKTVPLGSPCHDPNYDEAACATVQDAWKWPMTHIETSSSVMQNWFANQSCDAFTAEEKPCTLGNYVSYAVKVSNARQVAAAVQFANYYNIRLVVRNTAHDYFGRSTGAGGLAIWTHHLKNTEVVQWADKTYNGPAFKLGAGIQGFDSVEYADSQGLTSVPGECPTVGLAGFTLGGGHSPLSSSYGLGADNTLEFEVVTAAGRIVRASATENSDLYWALSGGGGASFGIVTSMTVRAHKTTTIGGATLTLVAGTDKDVFYNAVTKFHELLPAMIDHDATVTYILTSAYLSIKPVTIANSTGDYVRDEVLAPFTDYLSKAGLTPTVSYTTLSFRDHYELYNGPLPGGHLEASQFQFGGRLIPRSVLETNNVAFNKALRSLGASGVLVAGSSGKFEAYPGVSNGVPSYWRKAAISLQIGTLWDSTRWEDMIADQKKITEVYMPQLKAVTPGSGTYMNEADFYEPDWKNVFYGTNWDRLNTIKRKWDPNSFFYNFKGVGSEAWTVAKDGRMCKA